MFTLFHFGFEIFKIALQAAAYSSILLVLKIALAEITGNDLLRAIKFRQLYFLIAGLMLVFSFTYYGNHGLGDEAKLPLGHMKTINSTDGYAYFNIEPNNQISIENFLVHNDNLCFASTNSYYYYQLTSGKHARFNSRQEYETHASAHNLPSIDRFETFYPQYDTYWNGWRFWLLP